MEMRSRAYRTELDCWQRQTTGKGLTVAGCQIKVEVCGTMLDE